MAELMYSVAYDDDEMTELKVIKTDFDQHKDEAAHFKYLRPKPDLHASSTEQPARRQSESTAPPIIQESSRCNEQPVNIRQEELEEDVEDEFNDGVSEHL